MCHVGIAVQTDRFDLIIKTKKKDKFITIYSQKRAYLYKEELDQTD